MINVSTDEIRLLGAAAEWVPRLRPTRKGERERNGRRERDRKRGVDASTLFRWCTRGKGGIKLEYVVTPSGMATSQRAIQEFFERLTAAKTGGPVQRPSTVRRKAIEAAERELLAVGI